LKIDVAAGHKPFFDMADWFSTPCTMLKNGAGFQFFSLAMRSLHSSHAFLRPRKMIDTYGTWHLWCRAHKEDYMTDFADKMAEAIATTMNGGEFNDGKWYSEDHRTAWRNAVKPYAEEIERLRSVLQRLRRWGSPMVKGYIDGALGGKAGGDGYLADGEVGEIREQEGKE
jgi:hypothetical protein